jgi:YidC/Oxa1 family membrane protein insertase
MVNGLVLLYILLFGNLGLSILVFTALTRLATFPLTVKQLRSTRAMSQLQPKIQEIQKKYAKDRQKISQETFRMYRENGVNPIGCLGPMVVQMPILIGLYWALIKLLPGNPENLADLAGLLYSGLTMVHDAIPINSAFLGMDLAVLTGSLAFPAKFVLPAFSGASMWVQQKMMMTMNADPRQQQSQKMMLWMFPAMFVFISFQVPVGLVVYWVASNLIGIAIQYKITGWGGLRRQQAAVQGASASEPTPAIAPAPVEEQIDDGQHRDDRQERRRSRRASPKGARSRPRGGRSRGR